ncbi:DUF5007 domain-containing protein [Chitinophaga sp. Cy-1792]|uniref:DUF5007 domain-containing protein n=1 Tax=Chitinophaga sp. Cy-1792 TaxID=2608339 RepID=UPI00141FB8D2|nr:DUF5007 domain-containing protein [Chitinophaga sp. Cy-1792]NIG54177.1 DUF5007 domain-containing protein [Chitinophaga sp. Cy-1792]
MRKIFLVMMAAGMLGACVKLPADADFLSSGAGYTQTNFQPVIGRTTVMPEQGNIIFNSDNSTLPLTFKMLNVREVVTGDTTDLFNKTFDVQVWKHQYTGLETTREEIEAKRTIEQHHLFEVREHSGQLVFWAPINLSYLNAIRVQPDPGYKFDVEVSNGGGSKVIRNLELQPLRAQPYWPTNIDPVTGNAYGALYPQLVSNMKTTRENTYLFNSDVQMVFFKDPKSTEHTLSFEFRDSSYNLIDPKKFNITRWDLVCHHFGDPVFTPENVTYQVAYPIPLAPIDTRYVTSGGQHATAKFGFNRISGGGFIEESYLGCDFNIYEPGAWKIIFWFYRGNPDFGSK